MPPSWKLQEAAEARPAAVISSEENCVQRLYASASASQRMTPNHIQTPTKQPPQNHYPRKRIQNEPHRPKRRTNPLLRQLQLPPQATKLVPALPSQNLRLLPYQGLL